MKKEDKKELRQTLVCDWLNDNYLQFNSLRYDELRDRLQVKCLPNPPSLGGDGVWRDLTDKDLNSMVCQCVNDVQANINVTEMWTALKSDMVPTVHPLRVWLEALRPYTPDQPDWIDMVAKQVHVKGNDKTEDKIQQPKQQITNNIPLANTASGEGGYIARSEEHIHEARQDVDCRAMLLTNNVVDVVDNNTPADHLWRLCFKKWFVAMVASWMYDEVVNHTVLVLVGRQGIYKTTWLEHLIPPALRAYSSKLPLSGQITKDDRLRLCENGMLNMDELDAMCGREMNIVKSLLTSTDVNERAAYGRLKERRVRLASFCASTNNREFLTDITGNRRWLPFEVESIQNPFYTTLPYELMYAEAVYLVKHDFNYWFDMEEIGVLEEHNEHFRVQDNEEQLLPILFDVPAEGKGEFMTTAQISERLVTYGNIKKPIALSQLGKVMLSAGYTSKRQRIGKSVVRGWLVYQRVASEIDANKRQFSK